MQRQIGINSIQNSEKTKGGAAALINRQNEEMMDENFSEMFSLSTSSQVLPFSMAKRSLLAKNASATDLTQYINPVLVNRRRSSLFCSTVDSALKKMRQREAYKTAMCQAWLEGRTCVYADQCNFAHGEDELQPLPTNRSNPKHKTRICENYTSTGICPFGNRCYFIHPKTDEEMGTLLKFNENFPQQQVLSHHQLEVEALVHQPPLARSPQKDVMRQVSAKQKQFRKMDSCGTFTLPYHLQTEQNTQQQPLQQWSLPEKAGRDVNYGEFTSLSSSIATILTGKSLISMNSPNMTSTTNSSLMPLIHSTSVTNLNYTADQKIECAEKELDKRLAEMRITMRKISQQKSFSSNDVCKSRVATQNQPIKKQEEAEKESSGTHTPPLPALSAYSFPGFYERERLGWSNTSSLASVWSPPTATEQRQQAVPTFTFESISQFGGRMPSIERGSQQLLRVGKRSPDFEGILMGRRSSHIPLLEENNELLLNVLESGIQKIKNKSAEYLSGCCGDSGGDKESAKQNGTPVADFWQPGKCPSDGVNGGNGIGCQFDEYRDKLCDLGSGDCASDRTEKEKKEDGNTVAAGVQWGEIGRQSCGSTKLLNTLQTNESFANGFGDNGAFQIGHNSISNISSFSNSQNNIIQPISPPRCSEHKGISNLDKMQHLWTSSSPNLDNKYRSESPPSHQLWTPFGIQKVEIPSLIDLTKNYNDSSLNMSEQRDRIDTLTYANQSEDKDEEELVNLYSKNHPNDGNAVKKEKLPNDDGDGINEFISPSWAQMVRRKSCLRHKSYSSPAINRNCSAQSAGSNM